MIGRRAGALLFALAALACKPEVRGLCNETADCRPGAYCALEGICLAASGTCSPACKEGEICSGSVCAPLKPVVSVKAPATAVSPAHPQVTVSVEAPTAIELKGLKLEMDATDHMVASGQLDGPLPGNNLMTLSNFVAGAVGTVSLRATLTYRVPDAAADATVSSVAVPVTVDNAVPTVAVFVPPAADAVEGWVPRNGSTLEVRATVDDGAGSGPQSATLTFDSCPAAVECSYAGTVLSQASGSAVFSFLVPRSAQAAGVEAPLAVTVKALDAAGNEAHGGASLLIDDAAPAIGDLTLVSAGTLGEDNNTWFKGGSSAAPVEIAIPVTDAGAGLATVTLHLDKDDLYGGFPTDSLDVAGTALSDGWHFMIPANGVRGAEGHLRFTVTATDKLGHALALGPDNANTMIFVDAVPPTVTKTHIDYASASGTDPQCGQADSATFKCGRQGGTHLLADDGATVTFDAYDCGSGVSSQVSAAVSTVAGGSQTVQVNGTGKNGTPCGSASSNRTHHYSFRLSLATMVAAFDPPIDANGTTLVQISATAADKLGQSSTAAPSALATSGDGVGVISLWRWKNQVTVNAQPAGSAALLPGTLGARQIAVGTTLPGSSANVFVLNADGTNAWSNTAPVGMAGDVAVGSTGVLYVSSAPAASCTSSCNAHLYLVSQAAVEDCAAASVSFGAPPAIISAPNETAAIASTNHNGVTQADLYFFSDNGGSCQAVTKTVAVSTDYNGISASATQLFLAGASGFTSVDYSNTSLSGTRSFNGSVTALSPPGISLGPVNPIFGTVGSDHSLRRTKATTCLAAVPCWDVDGNFTVPTTDTPNPLPYTPIFDAANIYTADDHGKVASFNKSSGGAAQWTQDLRTLPSAAAGATVSAPVLLQGGSLLVVRSDGQVALASQSGVAPLIKFAALASPVAPVVETRGGDGVAYAHDGEGWIWAVQVPAPPVAAGSAVWPRPGRDSCNSRNAGSSCQ